MLTVDFINVGYGDAVLVRETETPFTMLVDCGDVRIGASAASRRVTAADYLRTAGVRSLDLLVLTHLHLDHAGGLCHLFPEVAVKEFWTNYLPLEDRWGQAVPEIAGLSGGARCLLRSMDIYLAALAGMRAQGTRIRQIGASRPGLSLAAGLTADLFLEDAALHRRQAAIWEAVFSGSARGGELDELDGFINNTSIRLRLTWGGHSVELPGDVYAACWERHRLSPCTIVKLPHHGHADAVTPRLLEMLRPSHTVISVSNDRPDDCPSAAALRAVEAAGSRLYVTDGPEGGGGTAVRFRIGQDGVGAERPGV